MDNEMIDIELEELDLLKEMDMATEYKPNTSTIEPMIEEINNDFDPEPPTEIENEENENTTINASELTDLIIEGSDMLLEYVLPFLYRKSIAPSELQTLSEIARTYKQAKQTQKKVLEFTEHQQEVMNMYIDYEDYKENLPLTSQEKKNLRKPLSKLLSSIDFKASPENTLLAVVSIIMLPRLLPILGNYFIKNDKLKNRNGNND